MEVTARLATVDDLEVLLALYRGLEEEMVGLEPIWRVTSGLPDPVDVALLAAVVDEAAVVTIGEIESQPFGFLIATDDPLLPQAHGERLGSIRYVFTVHEAREVGVGEAMRDAALSALRTRGITKFDAHVVPGHRLSKNFFEQAGFAARSIIMHHDDNQE